jgi:hypothetical protein
MKHRKLRIVWSVVWGIVAVSLCVLWVRSYWVPESIRWSTSTLRVFSLRSQSGRFGYVVTEPQAEAPWAFSYSRLDLSKKKEPWTISHTTKGTWRGVIPCWAIVVAVSALSLSPWLGNLPRRFSIRTLLLATTLVAVGLGLIVWLR